MKIAVKKTAREVARDWNIAHLAGLEAVARVRETIKPMVVVGREGSYIVPDGVCGFAWLEIRPARGSLVTFLKKSGIGSVSSYHRCYWVNISDFRQSLAMKEAYAHAVADALSNAGYEVCAGSRID